MDRKKIGEKFEELIREIENGLERGMADGTVAPMPVREGAFMIYAAIVGAVRTVFLTPFGDPALFEEARRFILRAIAVR